VTRVVAGAAKGRRLEVPAAGTRPTSDRAREALFSALDAELQQQGGWGQVHFLDLYAGSGAVGLEALSRGAAEVLLVESRPEAARVARRNVDVVDLPGATVQLADVERLVRTTAGTRFDVAFLDPPYEVDGETVRAVLVDLAGRGWLAERALVVVERASRGEDFDWPAGFDPLRSRRYGEATLWFGRFGTVAAC
jgi:16S rRNA (guanine966-N2)-methyltransferase